MSRVMLIFATALVALLAGALFYAARLPVTVTTAQTPAAAPVAAPKILEVVSHPAFTLPDITGTERNFSEWQGKNRLLNFWATWCAPCRREIPLLKDFQTAQAGNGFQVIGIAVDYPEAVAAYDESAEFNYPVLVGEQDAMAVAESSGIEFIGMPFTMFVASDGEYLGAFIGELHQPQLDKVVELMTRLDRGEIEKDEARTGLDAL
ncbi:MAG: TlpA family protein disulfide reductase [Gammaproteobacteria bacterium]|nr:TlpA family protein disulfide reductase [Gammaproteobacteria bacterium]MBT8111853.1 TlpA family protein disulfide reductase [Gammaproteobacteria bacterium]NND48499.1 TlpA family protein disulfide reductase [Woeseiaceae bacterium]NNL46552.1 TlpA family protein disulfide reductase [Woeseiaceae bacterium]